MDAVAAMIGGALGALAGTLAAVRAWLRPAIAFELSPRRGGSWRTASSDDAAGSPYARLQARLDRRSQHRRERQRRFKVELPRMLGGELPGASENIPYVEFWRSEGLCPPAVMRMAVTVSFLDRGRDLTSVPADTTAWWLTRTGFALGLPWSEVDQETNLRRCGVCGRRPRSIGALAAAETTTIVLHGCDCGRGFGLWSLDAPEEEKQESWVVLALEPGPHRGRCGTALVAPAMPDDPLPPLAYVTLRGRVVGLVAWVGDRLLFTNDLCSDPMLVDAAPIPLTDAEIDEVERFVTAAAPELLDAMRAARRDPRRCRTIWDLVGLQIPDPESAPEETAAEPLIAGPDESLSDALLPGIGAA